MSEMLRGPELEVRKKRAKDLYLQGLSLREIAAEVLPEKKQGHIQIHRWAKAEGWAQAREAVQYQKQESHDLQIYFQALAEIRDRHLALAQKAQQVVEAALDAYTVKDASGRVVDIKRNRYGDPLLGSMAMVQLMTAATELEYKALGMQDGLPQEDAAQLIMTEAPKVVDADLAKAIGDYLAAQALGSGTTVEAALAPPTFTESVKTD